MKKQLRTSPAAKVIAVLLALVLGAGGFLLSLFTLAHWDDLWTGASYLASSSCYSALSDRFAQIQELATLLQRKEWNGSLTYLEQQQLDELERALSPENTNYRFRLLDNGTGKTVYSTLEDTQWRLHDYSSIIVFSEPDGERRGDYTSWDDNTNRDVLHIALPDGRYLTCVPDDPDHLGQAAQYGWFPEDDGSWYYDSGADIRYRKVELAVEYGLDSAMAVTDEFSRGMEQYDVISRSLPYLALAALAADVVFVLVFVFLCLGAGRRRGREGITLSWFDRIPLDVLVVLELLALAALLSGGNTIAWTLNSGTIIPKTLLGLGIISLAVTGCLLAFLLTLAARIKAGTVFSNTLIWMLCKAIALGCRRASAAMPLTWRVVVFFLLYLLGTFLTALTVFLVPFYQGFVLWLLCRWTLQWKAVRAGTAKIVGGDPEHKIDTNKMYPDLAEHAGQLNALGGAVSNAVDERMKSERFKAELITNVSHDLKTPLTSIINYVDLLKKEDIENPRAQEYIEVLDRKSQRLKKLTEDLVEASKASTGALSVRRETLGVVQLLQQALGEFEEKFAQQRLEPILTVPDGEVWVAADGRHLWRVIDNLLSNCNKYALEGTRVYLDVVKWDGQISLSVKNISRQRLNIPADQLMERFVRGDEARTTEGSGLGLSIARSLTELQGGTFRLDIDGDLFKAVITFPEAAPPAQVPPASVPS